MEDKNLYIIAGCNGACQQYWFMMKVYIQKLYNEPVPEF